MAKSASKLLLNVEEGRDHKAKISALLKDARSVECMVAFAKFSAWKDIKPALLKALARGARVRFAIGLDFFHTDPVLLSDLLKIAMKPGSLLRLYISAAAETFHPKIYAFKYADGCKVLVGSANFTQGGLADNYEASILVDDDECEMMSSVISHFDQLIDDGVIIPATKARIDRYAYEHEIFREAFRLAKRRAKHTVAASGTSLYALSEFLDMMKEGAPESRFDSDMLTRRDTRRVAEQRLREMAKSRSDPAEDFSVRYSSLISAFHSGGINRSKSFVSAYPAEFTTALSAVLDNADAEPGEAFAILHAHFGRIKGAGINLLTEILHSLDNQRFAVMNQNSVAGLRMAGYREFPQRPMKGNVDGEAYQSFCQGADQVRSKLGLNDFTELDALFNFVYWHDNRAVEDEDEDA
ncbi:HKD family nuclease [Novosphingobium fluoreni]|uniref:HKD family nuclease n=1 Tax=Novosphingobium fluoreni TaxID=1391222 RepID=A0A7W6FZP3_9SPHN|nr:HKD family nuclease [Novosphingobium fluoreni]